MRFMIVVLLIACCTVSAAAQQAIDTIAFDTTTREIVSRRQDGTETRIALPVGDAYIGAVALTDDHQTALYCINPEENTVVNAFDLLNQTLLWSQPLERSGYCTFGRDATDGDTFFLSVQHYNVYFPPDDATGDVYTPGIYSLTDGSFIQRIPLLTADRESDHGYAIDFTDGILTLGAGLYPYKGGMRPRDLFVWDGSTLSDLPDDARTDPDALIYADGTIIYDTFDEQAGIYSANVFSYPQNLVMQEVDGVQTPLLWVFGDIAEVVPMTDGTLLVRYFTPVIDASGNIATFERQARTLATDGTLSAPQVWTPPDNYELWLYRSALDVQGTVFQSADNLAEVQANIPIVPLTACENVLTARLMVNSSGRVIGGASNVRAQPTRSAGIMAQIPDGATFFVVSGPTCDAEGILWWQVAYGSDTVGYVAELQGDAYFVEPSEG